MAVSATSAMVDSLEIRPVASRRDLKAFVTFPWQVYRGDPLWVPPLISDRMAALDASRGPFFKDADVALLMARRDGKVTGTIAPFVDHARVRHTSRSEGGFGFFEVIQDYEAARCLLEAGTGWLRSRGMTSVRGPTSFGDNDWPGILIQGREYPPAMMEAHTPPYYREFLERFGMQKDHDLYAWRATFEQVGRELGSDSPGGASSDIVRVADAVRKAATFTVRSIRLDHWAEEVAIIRSLFNATLDFIPDAVPVGEEEFRALADQMRPFLDPALALIAEADGKPVAYCVLIPDTNRVLARLNGRLFPFHILKVKRYIREIDVVSFKLMGVLKQYQRRGLDALLYVEALTAARSRGYKWLDGSLTSELNPAINLIARGRGAEMYKHYRLYRMDL
jgi:GNAT superfamily N-acetyltransferase